MSSVASQGIPPTWNVSISIFVSTDIVFDLASACLPSTDDNFPNIPQPVKHRDVSTVPDKPDLLAVQHASHAVVWLDDTYPLGTVRCATLVRNDYSLGLRQLNCEPPTR